MNKEYAIWGKSSKNPDDEAILLSHIPTLEGAKRGEKILIENHGCYETRIQTITWDDDVSIKFKFK